MREKKWLCFMGVLFVALLNLKDIIFQVIQKNINQPGAIIIIRKDAEPMPGLLIETYPR